MHIDSAVSDVDVAVTVVFVDVVCVIMHVVVAVVVAVVVDVGVALTVADVAGVNASDDAVVADITNATVVAVCGVAMCV